MDTNNDIQLYDLETIEDNLSIDDAPARDHEHAHDADTLHASASAFLVG